MTTLTDEQHVAAIRTVGYTVLPDAINPALVKTARNRLIELVEEDVNRFGCEYLMSLREHGRTRLLPNRGKMFVELLEFPEVHSLIESILGEYRILYYNGTSLLPSQSRATAGGGDWHVDVHLCAGDPQWLNVFYLLDDFTIENGGTWFISGSQQRPFPGRKDTALLEALKVIKSQSVAKKGSVIVFDSTIWHSAGDNHTDSARLMVAAVVGRVQGNVRYQTQFDHRLALDPKGVAEFSPLARRLFGLDDQPLPTSLKEYFAQIEAGRKVRR